MRQSLIESVKKGLGKLLPTSSAAFLFFNPSDHETAQHVASFERYVASLDAAKTDQTDEKILACLYLGLAKMRMLAIAFMVVFTAGAVVLIPFVLYYLFWDAGVHPSRGEAVFTGVRMMLGCMFSILAGPGIFVGIVNYSKRVGIGAAVLSVAVAPIAFFGIIRIINPASTMFGNFPWIFIVSAAIAASALSLLALLVMSAFAWRTIAPLAEKYASRLADTS